MKKIAVLLLVSVLSLILIQCSDRTNPVDVEIPQGLIYQNSFVSASILAGMMQEAPSRDIIIYTPPGYDAGNVDLRYPVLYLLHGYGGNHNYYRALFGLATTMDRLIYDGEIEPMLVVTADASSVLGGSFYTNSPDYGSGPFSGNMQDFITEEVVHIIDSVYNTYPERQYRAIAGHSMGGYGALKLAMIRNDLFAAAGSMSAPLAFWGTNPTSDLFDGIAEFIPYVFAENGIAPGDSAGFYSIQPGAGKSITNMIFAMAAAFSPHDPADTITAYAHYFTTIGFGGYVDLPFDVNGQLAMSVWSMWLANDVTTLFATQFAGVFDSTLVYIDAGEADDLYFDEHARIFANVFASVYSRAPDFYEVYDGIAGLYDPDHATLVGTRLPYLIRFVNDAF